MNDIMPISDELQQIVNASVERGRLEVINKLYAFSLGMTNRDDQQLIYDIINDLEKIYL